MLFPTRTTESRRPSPIDYHVVRVPNLEMYSTSGLYQYAVYMTTAICELDKEWSVTSAVDNRKRFLSAYNSMQRDAALYQDAESESLLRSAGILNTEHRSRCLKVMLKLKQTPNVDCDTPNVDNVQAMAQGPGAPTTDDLKVRRELKVHYTSILKGWVDNHSSHPFPTKKEKAELCSKAIITERQLNNWFTNYRRRHRQHE
ncbi:Homeobox protein tgif1 [Dissophora globulifera]|uniref:Homeobox protein tgif1 n=1 Tax=Dissophora globulifera TaxID=979702 RepID=A0A9P6UYJ1_9FUNG|nr:Homeobox protein tgif1 [Dissophora globulifera]